MCLFWKTPIGLLKMTLKVLQTFCCAVCESFMTAHLLRIRGQYLVHRTSQTSLSDTQHLSSYLHFIYFCKLYETITLLTALVPGHTNLQFIFALWYLFTVILLF